MRVCKYALKMAARRPLFFLIYAVGLSVMGVVMALAVTGAEPAGSLQDVVRPQLQWGLVDEDHSQLAAGLIDSLGELGPRVEVAQDRLALCVPAAHPGQGHPLDLPVIQHPRILAPHPAKTDHCCPYLFHTSLLLKLCGHLLFHTPASILAGSGGKCHHLSFLLSISRYFTRNSSDTLNCYLYTSTANCS